MSSSADDHSDSSAELHRDLTGKLFVGNTAYTVCTEKSSHFSLFLNTLVFLSNFLDDNTVFFIDTVLCHNTAHARRGINS